MVLTHVMADTLHPAVVLFVADLQRMAGFYRDVAGCTVLSTSLDHWVLDASGLELVLHGVPADYAGTQDPDGPRVAEDAALKLCLPVTRLAHARELARQLGGGLRDASEEWDGDGYRACDGWDPEGTVVQFREPLPGAAEGSTPAA